jgi:hypothetical protein
MHTFGVILVLLPEQHVILFAHINLLVVYTEIGYNLFRPGISLLACYASSG